MPFHSQWVQVAVMPLLSLLAETTAVDTRQMSRNNRKPMTCTEEATMTSVPSPQRAMISKSVIARKRRSSQPQSMFESSSSPIYQSWLLVPLVVSVSEWYCEGSCERFCEIGLFLDTWDCRGTTDSYLSIRSSEPALITLIFFVRDVLRGQVKDAT